MLLVNFTFFLDILLHILHILAMTANGVNLGGWFSETTYDVAAKLADITANANAEVHAKADVRNNANLTNNMQVCEYVF